MHIVLKCKTVQGKQSSKILGQLPNATLLDWIRKPGAGSSTFQGTRAQTWVSFTLIPLRFAFTILACLLSGSEYLTLNKPFFNFGQSRLPSILLTSKLKYRQHSALWKASAQYTGLNLFPVLLCSRSPSPNITKLNISIIMVQAA